MNNKLIDKMNKEKESFAMKCFNEGHNKDSKLDKIIEKQIDEKEITEAIYTGFGSDTGVLFGIPSNCRKAVETIVRLTISKVLELQEGK